MTGRRIWGKIGGKIAGFAMRMLFKFNKSVARSLAHALGDPVEITTAYNDLINTCRELGVDMPITKSFQADMEVFTKKDK